MSPLQIIFFLLLVVLSFVLVSLRRHRSRLINQVRGLNPIPLNKIYGLMSLNFNNTIEYVRSLGPVFPVRGWLNPWQMMVTITDPDDVHKVLNNPQVADKAYIYKFFNIERGLLASQHHIWKVHRKIINPAFAISNIRTNMIPVFRGKTDLMLHRLQYIIDDGDNCELVNHIKFSLVEISLATFAGENFGKEEIEEYSRCMTKRIESVARRFLNIIYHWDALYKLTSHHREEQKCVKSMQRFVRKIITRYQSKWPDEGPSDRKLLVDLLMARFRDQQIEERDVIDELDTILFTSVDTSTHLIIFTLLMIAMKPQLQEELVAELQSVFYSPEVPFEYEQLKRLELMERVMKETVRLHPIVPFAMKVAKEPIPLSNCTIPEGVLTLIPIMSIHEDPKLWGENAIVFNPDNFLPENTKTRHPHAFIPFFAGRNCIGMVYAKFMITSILARILMNYRLETTVRTEQDIQTEYKITLNLKNKNPFRLFRRTEFYNNNEGLQ